jgi:hypothetical protein
LLVAARNRTHGDRAAVRKRLDRVTALADRLGELAELVDEPRCLLTRLYDAQRQLTAVVEGFRGRAEDVVERAALPSQRGTRSLDELLRPVARLALQQGEDLIDVDERPAASLLHAVHGRGRGPGRRGGQREHDGGDETGGDEGGSEAGHRRSNDEPCPDWQTFTEGTQPAHVLRSRSASPSGPASGRPAKRVAERPKPAPWRPRDRYRRNRVLPPELPPTDFRRLNHASKTQNRPFHGRL